MLKIHSKTTLSITLLTAFIVLPTIVIAEAHKHPAFLHALTDLKDARWDLEHRTGGMAVSESEQIAISEIDRALGEVTKAALEDRKNVDEKPHDDAHLDHSGLLHRAKDFLKQARSDVAEEDDNPETREIKSRALEHIQLASQATEKAISEADHRR